MQLTQFLSEAAICGEAIKIQIPQCVDFTGKKKRKKKNLGQTNVCLCLLPIFFGYIKFFVSIKDRKKDEEIKVRKNRKRRKGDKGLSFFI